jgi:DNA-directed RNA polymerase subunit RPC12/RpoP
MSMDASKPPVCCARCGTIMKEADRFCTQCGARVLGRSGPTGKKVLGVFCLTVVALAMGGVGACWLVLSDQSKMSDQWLLTGVGLLVVVVAWNVGMFKILRK